MRVENNNISFGRGIKVVSDSNSKEKNHSPLIDDFTEAVLNSMTGKKSPLFDDNVLSAAGEFLREQTGDYSDDTGIYIRKIHGNTYLFTGEEAKKAEKISRMAYVGIAKTKTNNEPNKLKRRMILNKRDKLLLNLTDNGKNGKPYSEIKIMTDCLKDSNATLAIEYYSRVNCGTEEEESNQVSLIV